MRREGNKKKKIKQTKKDTNPVDSYSANFCKSSKVEKCCSVLVAGLLGGEGEEGDVEKKVLVGLVVGFQAGK